MPLTFSHPMAAVPLARFRLPLSALVVGSMTPDFPYFLLQDTGVKIGHTIPGLFLFCLPAGLAALWLYHEVIKRPVLDLLPRRIRARLAVPYRDTGHAPAGPFPWRGARRFALICAAVVIGAFTHLLWDAFTGWDTWGTMLFPGLREPVTTFFGAPILGFRLVQHASTVVGALVLIGWSARWLHEAGPASRAVVVPRSRLAPGARVAVFGVIALVVAITAVVAGDGAGDYYHPYYSAHDFLRDAVIVSTSVFVVLVLLYSLVWRALGRTRQPVS